jgi:hypothetical protein
MTSTSTYHYVYRISNRLTGMHYYGVRTSKVQPKLDLGIKYFSSLTSKEGKEFKLDQNINPTSYKYKIIRIFGSRLLAVEHEILLHAKFNVKSHKKFYNKSNQTTIGFDVAGTTRNPRSKKYSAKMSISKRNKTIRKFYHTNGEIFEGTMFDFRFKFGLNAGSVSSVVKGKLNSTAGWSAKIIDHKFYSFIHDTGITFTGRIYDFYKKYDVDSSSVYRFINEQQKTAVGWRLKI